MVEDGWVEIAHHMQVGNRTAGPQRYRLQARGRGGLVMAGAAVVEVAPYESSPALLQLRLPPEAAQALAPGAHTIEWTAERLGPEGGETVRSASTFYVPG